MPNNSKFIRRCTTELQRRLKSFHEMSLKNGPNSNLITPTPSTATITGDDDGI